MSRCNFPILIIPPITFPSILDLLALIPIPIPPIPTITVGFSLPCPLD